jgi:hypothetical protein
MSFFFYLKTKAEVLGKFHFSSINLTMFSKKIWKHSPKFWYHKIEKKNHVTEIHFCTNFFWGRIWQRDNKRIWDFLNFLKCKFGKIVKLSKPKNWKKKKPHPVLH